MNKIIKTNIIKIVSFLLIFILIFASLDGIMKFKYTDGNRPINGFYEQEENTVDVLILGSSHAFSNFRPNVLWDKFGYSSYILSASVQPVWNTYFYLEEALKTQTPKVIIFEGYRLVEQSEFSTPQREIKSTYGMKFSATKLKALAESFKPEEILDYGFQFANYHSRYNEISKSDFVKYYNNIYYKFFKGEVNQLQIYDSLKKPDVSKYSQEAKPLAEKTEEYYIKMIELAKEHNIPFVTVIAPYNMPKSEYKYFKYAEMISAEHNVPFININENYDAINLDFKKDIADDVGHLNNSGATKLTEYIGNYIKDNYDVPDHRGDEKYESWQIHSDMFTRYYYNPVKEETNLQKYIETCESEGDYSYVFIVNDYRSFDIAAINALSNTLDMFGLKDIENFDGVYVVRDGELMFSSADTNLNKAIRFDSQTDIRLSYGEKEFGITKFKFNVFFANINNNEDANVRAMPNGITMIVYDDIFKKVVETVYYPADEKALTRENPYSLSTE